MDSLFVLFQTEIMKLTLDWLLTIFGYVQFYRNSSTSGGFDFVDLKII